MPFMCEDAACTCTTDVKPFEPSEDDIAQLSDEDREEGWDKEPMHLCPLHAGDRKPYEG